MLLYEDLISGEKLFSIEEDYMSASDYAINTDIAEYRQELIKIIMEVSASITFKIRCAAVSYFDRYASRYETSVVLGKDCEVLAYTCLITEAKVERNDGGKLLDFLQVHIHSAQVDLLKVLGWRLRLLTPLCFIDYLGSILYEQPVKCRLSDEIEQFLFETLSDIAYTMYRPSVLAAATLLLIQPLENYEQRLAQCPLDMVSLHECIKQMKTTRI
ncbi:cyclin-D3-1-like isoform X2 [Chenopodium quinoa]|uniref:cyclin-D3-1-like isoform X2 n=1 Tax=Chenopodium quinoa TaxID=63459 RepID=UPI000B78202B|nr:cyclin-D3-1-like isoform X2 [Chenopodium quinoa]